MFMVSICSAQFQAATMNGMSNTSQVLTNLSNITNATVVHNSATNTSYLLLPANGANLTALQDQFGNNTPQFIQNNTVILIPFNATQHQNISELFPSVVNHTYIVNMTLFDQRPNQSTISGNTYNAGIPANSAPSTPSMYPRGEPGFVIPPVPGNNPSMNGNRPSNPVIQQHPITPNNVPNNNMAPNPNNVVQHTSSSGNQPNNNSGQQPSTPTQNKNSGATLKSSLIYIVVLEAFMAYFFF